ncbi:PREDICTED: uncharacterized protein LOC108371017 [Rhagoletis zephyria]|nr:PREDICTED: uncharacterized protein LOC108371017 [Rhagoletis zephyria]XP_017481983.1 PREDICTED: uncharacterized protein LOC108371017 [Rhagoletis zephyria]
MGIFPINTDEKLKEFDTLLATQADPYIRQINLLLGGNAERNLHQVFGHGIIMNFYVDGSFGKKRLQDYSNVFTAIIDAISTFSESSDKTLRAVFQRQKKKFFKQTSRNKGRDKEQHEYEGDSSDKDQ